jgi:hypothetical protein
VLAHNQIGVLADRLVVSLRNAHTTNPGRDPFRFSPQFWSRQGFRWKDTDRYLKTTEGLSRGLSSMRAVRRNNATASLTLL